MKDYCIVDRVEGDYAVIEYGDKVFSFPLELLPMHVKEGDVLDFKVTMDVIKTVERRKSIEAKMDRVFKDEA